MGGAGLGRRVTRRGVQSVQRARGWRVHSRAVEAESSQRALFKREDRPL